MFKAERCSGRGSRTGGQWSVWGRRGVRFVGGPRPVDVPVTRVVGLLIIIKAK